jgi:plasmid stabilization system protein ParE
VSLPVLVRRAAEIDVMRAEDWYEAQRPGLGHEFREAVDATIARIAEKPLAYPDRYHGARRALVRRFPYVLWYKALPDLIVVLRVSTAAAIPERWAPDFGNRRTSGFSGPALALLAPAAEPARSTP